MIQLRPALRLRLFPSLEQLWAMLSLTLIGVFLALVPTLPHDFWWHLKAGQLVAEQGIPRTNVFAWTLPADTPYVYATWLGEWLFYALYQLGGLPAAVLARNLLGLAGFTLVAIEARRRSGSWRLAALAALLAAAMTINNLTTRTQNWSWVPFGLYLVILGAYADGQVSWRALLALPATMAFWVNVHGAFILGLVLIALVAGGETLRRLFNQPRALQWPQLRALYAVGAATVLATLLNPLGPGIFGYVGKLLNDPSIQGLVVEWQPPNTHGLAGQCFYLSILALLAAFALARRRPSLTDMLLCGAFLWLAWGGQRNVMWYGMLAMPILAQCLAKPQPVFANARPSSMRLALPSALLSLLLLALLVAVQPPFKAALGLPQPYRELFVDLPGAPELFSADTPVAAAAYLRSQPGGRLFNEMGYGSYLDWALYPSMQVFIDPRIELYPLELWQDYVAIGEARDYQALLVGKYGVTRVLLDRQLQPRLAAALAADSAWQREYADARAEIYRRR
ncbi:MAG TPA: hypothetical protein VFX76_00195 [Roseiflexaceae bacterium]|nr:hypothetical protein [Roseiflexaceae bacterium]